MPRRPTLTKVYARDIVRLAALQSRLYTAPFDVGRVAFRGWDKFKRATFDYDLYHIQPPDELFVAGRSADVLNAPASIGFGGTVSPTVDGFRLSELLAQEAVRRLGAIVVAGGVFGIDMAAHLGALDANGRTVAVLANPPVLGLHPYEPRRTLLEASILASGGALVSEYETASNDIEERLLQRDRVVTALSDAFVAVECSKDSATVDAAKRANLQGRKVFAVDWSRVRNTWHIPKNSGALQLIREGVAEAIPLGPVRNITDPDLVEGFHALLSRR